MGDTVEVQVSRASGACVSGAGADGTVTLSATVPVRALWDAARGAVVVLRVLDGASGATIDASRVGALAATAAASSACVGPLASPVPVLVGGSWGPRHAPVLLAAAANNTGVQPGLGVGDTVTLTFDIETSRPPLSDAEVATLFVPPLRATVAGAWVDPRTLVLVVESLAREAPPGASRIGGLTVRVSGSLRIQSRDLSSPPANATARVAGGWGNAILSITGAPVGRSRRRAGSRWCSRSRRL